MKKPSKNLLAARKRVAKQWKHYRVEKKKILGLKRMPLDLKRGLLAEKREITKQNITTEWTDYRGIKYSLKHASPYDGMDFRRTKLFAKTTHKDYKLNKNYNLKDLNKDVSKILTEDKIKSVIVIIKVKDEDTGLVHFVSDNITVSLLKRLRTSVYEHVAMKAQASRSMQEYTLMGVYLQIVYENA